jgi:diguanylate cyclase (GGDEF)-like protein/PAS domain S-box-containing protein
MNTLHAFELHTILNKVPNPVFIKDENLRFVFVNKAYETMFNVKMKHILGKSVLELDYLSEEDRMFYQKEDTEMLQRGKTRHHIFDYLYKRKKVHTCLYWTSGFVQENGVRGLIGVIVDINEQADVIHRLRDKLQSVNAEKKSIAEKTKIDPLTRVFTRGTFDEALKTFTSSAGVEGVFSCIMFDIDHFKQVNDVFGHIAGDAVLREVAAALKTCARKRDLVCRYGGEEFVFLLPGYSLDTAKKVAERARRRVLKTVHAPDGQCVTVSAGCSEYVLGESALRVVQRADKALYEAKESGRNRVCTA